MKELLVFGYCRQIEHHLDNKIIPKGICKLCFMYYLSSTLIFYFYTPQGLVSKLNKSIVIHDMESNKKFECIIASSAEIKSISSNISYTQHLTLPKIPNSIPHEFFNTDISYHHNNHQALILSMSSVSHMLVINENQLHSHTQDDIVTIYDWKLPRTYSVDMRASTGTIDLFSRQHGLFKLGGYDGQYDKSDCYRLPFVGESFIKQDLNRWKWEKIANMKFKRYKGSGVILNNNCNVSAEKVVVFGGYYYDPTGNRGGNYPTCVEIFDMETNTWSELCAMENAREEMGILYDKEYGNNRIYLGGGVSYVGGRSDTHTVDYFDLNKMKWISLGHTNWKHINYPILWTESKDLVFIASSKYGVERIDLRQQKNIWIKDERHFANWSKSKSATYIAK